MRRSVAALGICAMSLVTAAGAPPGDHGSGPAAPGPQQPTGYTFATPAGVLFFHVRPDRVADFEAVVSRIGAVLEQAQDPARKQQAASWRVFKSAEQTAEAVVYLFFFDPAVQGADYDPVKLIGEAAPAEAQPIYERLKAATLKVERMALHKLR
jgi:hypothetical protein